MLQCRGWKATAAECWRRMHAKAVAATLRRCGTKELEFLRNLCCSVLGTAIDAEGCGSAASLLITTLFSYVAGGTVASWHCGIVALWHAQRRTSTGKLQPEIPAP